MAKLLTIDWSPPRLNVLSVSTTRGKAKAEASLTLELEPNGTSGRALKDALTKAGIAAAPVLFTVGRDKLILKEMSIPFVSAQEEPAIVRFQAAKELTEAASDVVMDYTPLSTPTAGQQTRVLVVVLRKSVAQGVSALCQSAGLKLHGIVPRPLALAGLLDRRGDTTGPACRGLVLPVSDSEVEFNVYSSGMLAWARTLSRDPGLASEIGRNLMLLGAQKPDLPAVERVETTGLADLGSLPVDREPLEAWRDNDVRPANPVPFLPSLGLAELAARSTSLPINLAAPKEPRPVTEVGQQRRKLVKMAAIVIGPLLLLGWYWGLTNTRSQIKRLENEKISLEEELKGREQDRRDIAALKEWESTTISWLDELYDIAARFPHVEGLRITQVAATQVTQRGVKDKYTGRITIHGVMTSDHDAHVAKFLDALHQDSTYLKVQSPTYKANEFVVKIDVAPRPPSKYQSTLVVPPIPKRIVQPEPEAEMIPDPFEEGFHNE